LWRDDDPRGAGENKHWNLISSALE
jgi:hypothetical protein